MKIIVYFLFCGVKSNDIILDVGKRAQNYSESGVLACTMAQIKSYLVRAALST